jgi:hypothetical protein
MRSSRFALVLLVLGFPIACRPEGSVVDPALRSDGADSDAGNDPSHRSLADGDWSVPVNLGAPPNTAFNEQGPSLSSDGLRLYFGSDRPGGSGGFDIWVSRRACKDCPWEDPENLGPTVNSNADDSGPGLSLDGHLLFFRSLRAGGQGLGDIYLSRRANPKDDFGWGPPVGLGHDVNTAAEEAGADYVQSVEDGTANLYFNRRPLGGTADLYYASVTRDGETRGPAVLISELSHPTETDQGPTVRTDGREIFFFSTRPGSSGGLDLWTSTRRSVHHAWATPVNPGAPLNSTGFEQQPSLSDQGRTLVFASNRSGSFGGTDIWISTRRPDAGPTLDVVAASADFDGSDLDTGEGLAVAADEVGTEQAATGGRATGNADITVGSVGEKISFSALSTGTFPDAKGQTEVHIRSELGLTDVHADVDCLAILGNNAWVSGPVRKFRRNGEDIPLLPGFQMLFRVQDNGDGGATVDEASLIVARFAVQVCRNRGPLPLVPSDNGNIQVSQR